MHLISFYRIALIAALITLTTGRLIAHKEYVHQYLAIEALKLLLNDYPGLAGSPLASHIGTQSGNCEGFQFTDGTITAGAYREDCEDPVYQYGDLIPGLDNAYFSASHFWDADKGDNSTIEICDVTCGNYQNAFKKSLRYILPAAYGGWTAKLTWPAGMATFYSQGGGTESLFHNGEIGFEYDDLTEFYKTGLCRITGFIDIVGRWQTASTVPDRLPMDIIAPQNVRDRIAWEVIGRITHLLGDMGVPAHAHNDIHPPFWWNNEPADLYEEEMGRIYTAWTFQDALSQGGLLDLAGAVPGRSPEGIMRYLFYTTNQIADRFPSNDRNGDTEYNLEWGEDDYSVLNLINDATTPTGSRDLFHREAADFSFVYSIRAIAGLYQWFAMQTGLLNVIPLNTNFPGGTILVNDKPRESPLSLVLPAGSQFTLEARDQWSTDPVTHAPARMIFRNWESAPGMSATAPPGGRIEMTAGPDLGFVAIFDREVNITLTEPVHLEGGSGGAYTVNGIPVGAQWAASALAGSTDPVSMEFIPPAGDIFLQWNDGERDNPRLFVPGGDLTIHALYKNRLRTLVQPGDQPTNQSRIARRGASPSAGWGMVYESGGNIFYCESDGSETWGDERLLNDGAGIASNPSIDFIDQLPEGESGPTVVWEERDDTPEAIRILGRMWDNSKGEWGSVQLISQSGSTALSPAAPVVSGDLVAWRTGGGIMIKRFNSTTEFTLPGTDAASEGPVLDYYSPAGGLFAIAWTDGAGTIRFSRGFVNGSGWSSTLEIHKAPTGGSCRNADMVISDNGTACIAWSEKSSGVWKMAYRFVDPSNNPQAVIPLTECPWPGTEPPVPVLSHHRNDSPHSRDIDLRAFDRESGMMLSMALRPGFSHTLFRGEVEGMFAEVARSSIHDPGEGRLLVMGDPDPAGYTIEQELVAISGLPPRPGVSLYPQPGAVNLGSSVSLAWKCSPDARSYDLEVATTTSFTPPIHTFRTGIVTTSSALTGLKAGTNYFWRVRGVNTAGSGAYSAVSGFAISGPPAAPVLTGTTVQSGSIKFPHLSWSAPPSVSLFRLYRYTCFAGESCFIPSRPALVYEGSAREFTDLNTIVSTKLADTRAFYFVRAVVGDFASSPSNAISYGVYGNVVWSDTTAAYETSIGGNYPNPFNPSTTIAYTLASGGHLTLAIYNVLGEMVTKLFDGSQSAGSHSLVWNASGVPAGVYFLELSLREDGGTGHFRDRRKLLLLK